MFTRFKLNNLILLFSFGLVSAVSNAQVFLSQAEALKLVCGEKSDYVFKAYTSQDLAELEQNSLLGVNQTGANFFECKNKGKLTGYALIDEEVGKHEPITYIVGINLAGEITAIEIMVYRENWGQQVTQKDFRQQFIGKNSTANLRVGGDIVNISGATLSAKAIAKGSKRALFLWRKYYAKLPKELN